MSGELGFTKLSELRVYYVNKIKWKNQHNSTFEHLPANRKVSLYTL